MSTNYTNDFYAALDTLKADAEKVGMTLTSICRATKISRATLVRWRKEVPTTVMLMSRMQKVVRDEEARRAAGDAPAEQFAKELQQ